MRCIDMKLNYKTFDGLCGCVVSLMNFPIKLKMYTEHQKKLITSLILLNIPNGQVVIKKYVHPAIKLLFSS